MMSDPLPYYVAVYIALLAPLYALSSSGTEFLILAGVYTLIYLVVSACLIYATTSDTTTSSTSSSWQDNYEYQDVEEEITVDVDVVDVTAHFTTGRSQRYDGVRLTRNETDYQLEKPLGIKPHEHGLRPTTAEWGNYRFLPHRSIESLQYHQTYSLPITEKLTFKKAVYIGDDGGDE